MLELGERDGRTWRWRRTCGARPCRAQKNPGLQRRDLGSRILCCLALAAWQLDVAAELEAHGGKEFVLVGRLSARTEPRIQRRGKNRGGHAFVDGGVDGPAAFAGIGDSPGKLGEIGIVDERVCGQIEEP